MSMFPPDPRTGIPRSSTLSDCQAGLSAPPRVLVPTEVAAVQRTAPDGAAQARLGWPTAPVAPQSMLAVLAGGFLASARLF